MAGPPAAPRFTIGDAISTLFSVIGGNAGAVLLLSLPLALLGMLAQYAMIGSNQPLAQPTGEPDFTAAGVWYLALLIVYPVVFCSLTHVVWRHLRGGRVDFGRSLGVGLRNALPVVLIYILCMFAIFLGSLFLLLPGIFIALVVSLAIPVQVVEGRGVFGSISRSASLGQGSRLAMFGAYAVAFLLLFLVQAVVSMLPAFLFPEITAVLVFSSVAGTVISLVLYAVLPAVVYFQLRREKEGLDYASLESVFA